jgi:hypothetical protein
MLTPEEEEKIAQMMTDDPRFKRAVVLVAVWGFVAMVVWVVLLLLLVNWIK